MFVASLSIAPGDQIHKELVMKERKNVSRRGFLKALGGVLGTSAFAWLGKSPAAFGSEPEKPDKLTIRAWGGLWGEGLDEAVSKPFTDQYGIEIEYDRTLDYPMSSKLITAQRSGAEPPVDINWTVPALGLKESFMDIHEPLNTDLVPNLKGIVDKGKYDTAYTPNNEPWPVAPLYFYTVTLTYRTDMFDPEDYGEELSWKSLWDDSLRDQIGVYHEGWGTTPIFAKVWGEAFPNNILEASTEPWKKLKPNIALVGDDPEHVSALAEGETPIVITIPTNALEAESKGAPIGITVPAEGTLGKRDVLGVAKNIPENKKYWAMKYVNRSLDPETQTKFCEIIGTVPIVENAEPAQKYLENPAFPTSDKQLEQIFTVPAKVLVENQGSWFDRVAEIIG